MIFARSNRIAGSEFPKNLADGPGLMRIAMSSDADGIFRSVAFPGLWLDPRALYDDDVETLLVVLHQGLATPEHAAFAAQLANAREGRLPR